VVVQGLDHLEALCLRWWTLAGAMRNTESRTATTIASARLCCGRWSKALDRSGRRCLVGRAYALLAESCARPHVSQLARLRILHPNVAQ